MATKIPTTAEIRDRILESFKTTFNTNQSALAKSFIDVTATVLASALSLVYRYIGFLQLQNVPRFATDKVVNIGSQQYQPLNDLGGRIGVNQGQGQSAQMDIGVIPKIVGEVLPSGSQFIGDNNNYLYATSQDYILESPATSIVVRAISSQVNGDSSGIGAKGNLETGDTMQSTGSSALIETQATVISLIVTGADIEDSGQYRQDVINGYRRRPQGGAQVDYAVWGEEVEGVQAIYPVTGYPSEVDVFVRASLDVDPNGVPPQALLDQVLAAIYLDQDGLASRRPVGAYPRTLPIVPISFSVKVYDMEVGEAAEAIAQIEQSITEYLFTREPFIPGVTSFPRIDRITNSNITGIVDAVVSSLNGSFNRTETLLGNFVLTDPYILNPEVGQIAVLGQIDYVS